MTKQSHASSSSQNIQHPKSLLDKFSLGFEYDKTWTEAKRTTQHQANVRGKKK